ncbi:MAG: hypothetical protein JXB35_14055 [Anaerolineae bacterium]|nr:hypothetical protein [Anaerolineae bacterium]
MIEPVRSYNQRDARRAFLLNVINGGLYNFSFTLMDPNLVLVWFVSRLTASNILIGMIGAISTGGWFLPQFFLSGWVQTLPRKMKVYRASSVLRMFTWLVLVAALWFLHDPVWLLLAFFVLFTALRVISGFAGIPFMEITAKTVPANRRARLFAWRLVMGGLLGLTGTRIVNWALGSPLPFPRNFALLIFLSAICGGGALLAFSFTHEPEGVVKPRAGIRSQIQHGLTLLQRDGNFRNLLVARALLFLGFIAVPFYTVLAQRLLGAPDAVAGDYLAVTTVAQLAANLPWGWLIDNKGKLWGMRVAAWGWTVPAILGIVLVGAARVGWLVDLPFPAYVLGYPLFVLRGLCGPLAELSGPNLLLEMAPADDRALYLGVSNTVLGLVLILSGFGGGLVDWLGLEALFVMTVAVNILSLIFIARIKLAMAP